MQDSKSSMTNPKVIQGRIVAENNEDKEDWCRRSISVPNSGGYPQPGNDITVIDTEDKEYELKFTKSRKPGRVCLGQPGRLKNWYIKHYPEHDVPMDDVFLEFSGKCNAYRIYTSNEWKQKAMKHGHI